MVLSDATNVEGQAYRGRKRAYMYDASREMPSFALFFQDAFISSCLVWAVWILSRFFWRI